MKRLFFVVLLGLGSYSSAEAASWVNGNGQSCDVACAANGRVAVISGVYTKNGSPFYICAGNEEGYRAGYNLRPKWTDACVVGYGSKEKFSRPFRCLCSGGEIPPALTKGHKKAGKKK